MFRSCPRVFSWAEPLVHLLLACRQCSPPLHPLPPGPLLVLIVPPIVTTGHACPLRALSTDEEMRTDLYCFWKFRNTSRVGCLQWKSPKINKFLRIISGSFLSTTLSNVRPILAKDILDELYFRVWNHCNLLHFSCCLKSSSKSFAPRWPSFLLMCPLLIPSGLQGARKARRVLCLTNVLSRCVHSPPSCLDFDFCCQLLDLTSVVLSTFASLSRLVPLFSFSHSSTFLSSWCMTKLVQHICCP